MKTYGIQTPEGFYLINSNGFPVSWYGSTKTTDDPTKAKHYKREGTARGNLKARITERKNALEVAKKNGWASGSNGSYERAIKVLESLKVVELDVEKPNCFADNTPEVKFEKNKYRIGFSTKKSQANLYCRGCGIYFRKIPMLIFGGATKPARICPLCIQERAHEAQKLLDAMPEDQRTNYEGERFIHRMG